METTTGTFEVRCLERNDLILVTLEQNPPVLGASAPLEAVARVLNIEPEQIAAGNSPIQSVSVSRAKLLVPLKDSRVLNSLKPDYEALWRACDQLEVTGFYPFTRRTDKATAIAEARQFPLRAGFPEDAATGVAVAALGAYLAIYDHDCRSGRHQFPIAQGYAMGAPSLIEAIVDCAEGKVVRTAIRGSAQIIRRENVAL